jgi:autotransporter-associated beta strand protein
MKTVICVAAMLGVIGTTSAFAADYYVATNGNDSTGNGSITTPYATLAHAVGVVSAGDIVYVRGGTYPTSAKISLSAIGSAAQPYRIRAYPGEIPVFNCSGASGSTDAISISGNYWYLYGLVITNAAHNSIKIGGNNNTIERCVSLGARNTGINISGGSSAPVTTPSTNLILNCDSIRSFDSPGGGNADGFSAKWSLGTGNVFRGCRSWENSDDGWDLWMGTQPVLIDTCWTWRNGSNVWGSGSFAGNGNGFKLGGNDVPAAHRLVRSLAYQNVGNGGYGIDENNNTGILTVDNNTSWGNRSGAINLNHPTGNTLAHIIRNNVVISGSVLTNSSSILISNSWQVISPAVSSNDFLSMDTSFLSAPRQADGSLPINPLVRPVPNGRLVDKGANIGDPFYGSAPDLGAYESAVLTWRGDGVSNTWDSAVSTNWLDGASRVAFANGAFVTFDNSGTNSPSINLVGSLSPLLVTVASAQNYTFGGTGSLDGWMMSLVKSGPGQLTVTTSNTFGGGTTVSNGTLLVNNTAGSGTGTGAVTVVSGATLGGNGTIGGPVTVNGTLIPGNGVGTLAISNILAVNSGAVLQYALGSSNDLTAVSSNLTLGGTLNITDAGGFTNTTYRLFNYGGTLTYNGLTVGTKPNTNFIYTVSTSTVGQVNLIVSNNAASLVAGFSGSPTNGAAPLAVTFADNSTGSITNWFWDFGDGSTTNVPTATNALHTYAAGTYTVSLTVSGAGGTNTSTRSSYIVAINPPVAVFTASPVSGTEPLAVTFTDVSAGTSPLSLSWDLGDTTATNTAGGAAFAHTYAAGTYTVTLTASNSAGTSTLVSNSLITVTVATTPFQAWQLQYFNCTNCPQADANADPDGDGLNNQEEFLSGSDPTNSASALQIISVVPQNNGDMLITWKTMGGYTNAVQATAGDASGGYSTDYVDITTPPHIVIPGNGDVTTNYVDDGGATNVPSRFYRIRLVP